MRTVRTLPYRGGVSLDRDPPGQRPSRTETPGQRPLDRDTPDRDIPGQRPPEQRPPRQGPAWTETPPPPREQNDTQV